MATVEVTPAGTQAVGHVKVGFVEGALDTAGAVSLANDIATILNISFYIPGSDFGATGAQNKGQDVRLGALQTYEALGLENFTLPDLTYIENVQGVGTGTPKGVMTPDTDGWLICRWGDLASTDWALADVVDAFPVSLGMRWKVRTTTDEFGRIAYQQVVAVTGAALLDLAITT